MTLWEGLKLAGVSIYVVGVFSIYGIISAEPKNVFRKLFFLELTFSLIWPLLLLIRLLGGKNENS